MAKNDYHVIVYQILTYLYNCLKNDEKVVGTKISDKSDLYSIHHRYWAYVMRNLYKEGLIDGIHYEPIDGGEIIACLDEAEITPKGITYLLDNSFISKAQDLFKDVKSAVPFL